MKRALAVILTLALVAWFVAEGQWSALGELIQNTPISALAIAAAGFALSYALRALRVWDEFRHDAAGRFGTCLRIVLIHNAMVNIVPFRGGEAAFPILLGRNFGTPLGRAVASLVWFRLQDAFVVMALALAVWPGLPVWLRAGGILAVVATAFVLPRWARRTHAWHEGGRWQARFGKLRNAFAESTRHARFGWLWTIANWSVKLAAQAWLLSVLLGASALIGAAGALGAELAAILPVQGVAGFGTYEAGAAAALLPNGIDFETGLQVALALHLFVIACSSIAGALAWLAGLSMQSAPKQGIDRQ
ncbi:lysylphosphatidylglycerol synthase transmembrane domain-containing protein [Denitromonas ohlonensis]|uniref:Flippase-like domain-containing protein n=2 Tax=Denitromonas TaxID=139331 RepID=A0A557RER3_9RHOO|nr:lysylphosphatidylglycerol synthase transmembrane domain-containing protein [Denitromonas ohlonensis]TVO63660.1 flippase-like domain-containing protein [Denitromonas ohlonensis]TVO74194.1 flippase-like domain-containing protein [Denitromonas ohlonensis]